MGPAALRYGSGDAVLRRERASRAARIGNPGHYFYEPVAGRRMPGGFVDSREFLSPRWATVVS